VPGTGTSSESAKFVDDDLKQNLDEQDYYMLWMGAGQTVRIGKAFMKVRWDVEEGKIVEDIPKFDEFGKVSEWTRLIREGITYSGNRIDLVPYWNFAPDPKARFLNECQYVIEEIYTPYSKVEHLGRLGIYNMDAVRDAKDMIMQSGYSDPRSASNDFYYGLDVHRQDIRILDYWEDERHWAIAMPGSGLSGVTPGKGILLNKGRDDNPYMHQKIPYFDFGFDLDEKEMFPQGIIEPLRDNHEVQSTALNMFIDAITMNLRPMRIIDADLEIDIKDIQNFVPGKIIQTQEGMYGKRISDSIHELKPEIMGLLNSLLPFMQEMRREGQDTSGVTEYLTGSPGIGSNKTMGGTAILTQNALERSNMPTMIFSVGVIRMLKLMHSNLQQFGHPIKDNKGQYKFILFGEAMSDKMMRIQGMQILMPYIIQAGGNVIVAVKRLARNYGIPAIEEILPEDGSLEESQLQQWGQQMMMVSAGGGEGRGAL